MTPETKEKISAALRAKWASGTRKKNPPETYIKSSASHKARYAAGIGKPGTMTSEQARARRAMADPARVAAINAALGKARIGSEMPPGPAAKGPDHWKAKHWTLLAPNREVIEGRNLAELIRKNAHLFDPDDVIWKRSKCRAYKRLCQLFEMKKDGSGPKMPSWKGWMIGDRREVKR